MRMDHHAVSATNKGNIAGLMKMIVFAITNVRLEPLSMIVKKKFAGLVIMNVELAGKQTEQTA